LATTARRFTFAYLMLVGLPIAGLFGVLRHGRSLAAPVSIDGNWTLQSDTTALPCGMNVQPEDAVLNISQSGQRFELALPNGLRTKESGTLDGTSLKATLAAAGQARPDCSKDQSATFVATLNRDSRPRTLSGTITIDSCPSCAAIPFTAVRQKVVAKKGGH
jgi:hypothetical protein